MIKKTRYVNERRIVGFTTTHIENLVAITINFNIHKNISIMRKEDKKTTTTKTY